MLWMLLTSFKTSDESPAGAADDPARRSRRPSALRRRCSPPTRRTRCCAGSSTRMVAATGAALLVLVVASMAGVRAGPDGVPRQEAHLRGDHRDAVRAGLHLPDARTTCIIDRLGWLDTLWALIVPGAAGAFGVFFLRQFFLGLPRELEEAALIDGANTWQIFTRIILPLVQAGAGHARGAVASWPTGTTSSGRSTCCSAPSTSRCRRAGLLQGAYTIDYPVIMAGAAAGQRPGADPVHLRPALRHRRCRPQRPEGLISCEELLPLRPALAAAAAVLRRPGCGAGARHRGRPTSTRSPRSFADTFADPVGDPRQGRLLVRVRHHRPAARGRDRLAPMHDRPLDRPRSTGSTWATSFDDGHRAGVGRRRRGLLGARRPLHRRPVRHVLHGHRHRRRRRTATPRSARPPRPRPTGPWTSTDAAGGRPRPRGDGG